MSIHEYEDPSLILNLMQRVYSKEIADAMRDFADKEDEPASHFSCGECNCGYNRGEDEDCFACGEHENLYVLRWIRFDEEVVS